MPTTNSEKSILLVNSTMYTFIKYTFSDAYTCEYLHEYNIRSYVDVTFLNDPVIYSVLKPNQ